MEAPQVDRPLVAEVLKRDGFGRVERIELGREQMVRRVACGGRLPLSSFVARLLLARERRALAALGGLAGVPATAGDRVGSAPNELVRTWIAGAPLHRASALPADFFERLGELVGSLHERGVCHNDLHKEQNILVAEDGRPALIDFQLASIHPRRGRAWETRCRDDLRHVAKHERRYALRGDSSREAKRRAGALPQRSVVARVWRRLFKPLYEALVHRLLRRGPSEARRPNSGPWPERTPPVGPRGV